MPKLAPVHPGEVLKEEFLLPLGLSASQLASIIRVPANRVTRLISAQSGISADTARRLARAFNTSPDFWMNLQSRFDLQLSEDAAPRLDDIKPIVKA
ncbi:MAG: HigA family addiction module antidote protein [Hyphomonas sp.]|jgi:antitoxin HigA-1|nr:HigA family addiction module antidote protein [Hyphomonas sp.]